MSRAYLYVIADGSGDGPCKVGVTTKPKERLRALQTGNPRRLVFAELWRLPKDLAYGFEKGLHGYLSMRVRSMAGEWFDHRTEELVQIADLFMCCAIHAAGYKAIPMSGLIHNRQATPAGETA